MEDFNTPNTQVCLMVILQEKNEVSPLIKRQLVEELSALSLRAQSLAFHHYEEIEVDSSLSLQDQALYCFLLALEEKKSLVANNGQKIG